MALTPCTTGAQALYQHDEGGVFGIPVEAWDDTGAPLVAGRDGLVAVGAWRPSHFTYLRLAPAVNWTGVAGADPQRWPVRDPG